MFHGANQGCGVGVGVGVGLLRGLGVGVGVGISYSNILFDSDLFGISYSTPTPDVQFLYILVMLTAQLTWPRAPVEWSAVIFLRKPCGESRDTACDS